MEEFTFFDEATGFTATITVVENSDGTLSVTLNVDESNGVTGDVRALYFNYADDTEIAGLDVAVGETDGDASTTSDTTDIDWNEDINGVRHVDSRDTNINGEVLHENDGAFDLGIEFGTQGIANDDVQHMEFVLSATEPLSLDSFDWTTLGLRVTSVGDVDGSRDGSLKLTNDDPPPVDSTVDAVDDNGLASLATLVNGGTDTVDFFDLVLGPYGDFSFNDDDPDTAGPDFLGDTIFLTGLTGANGTSSDTADAQGWFDWVDGDTGGEIRVNANTGEVQIRDLDRDFVSGEEAITAVSYEITDLTGATDTATITILVDPTLDPD